jgi:hypothetical protein
MYRNSSAGNRKIFFLFYPIFSILAWVVASSLFILPFSGNQGYLNIEVVGLLIIAIMFFMLYFLLRKSRHLHTVGILTLTLILVTIILLAMISIRVYHY